MAGVAASRATHLRSADSLRDFASAVLERSGMRSDEAEAIGSFLVEANLRGVDGHGILRLLQYATSIDAGEINTHPAVTIRRRGATAIVDADGGYGFTPSVLAMDTAISIATEHGAGVVSVANSHHFGMASFYALRATDAGYVGIAISNTKAVLPAPGGLVSVVGNDPIAIAVPRDGESPVFVDLALSEASWGKISLAAARGERIPRGWAYDRRGDETTDPVEALAAQLLVPIGGAKGFALAAMLELLAGALTGSPVGPAADGHAHRLGGCGHLLVALDPASFGDKVQFAGRVEELVAAITSSPTVEGAPARLPGARNLSTRAVRIAEGVPVPEDVRTKLNGLALALGVEPL